MYLKVYMCLLRLVMSYVNKFIVCLFKKIFKLTLCQLLWLVFILLSLYLWASMKSDFGTFEKVSHNPVILWWTEGFPGSSETSHCPNNIKCEVFSVRNARTQYNIQAYLFYGSNIKFQDLPLPRRPQDVIWGLYHEESPRNVGELMHEPILNLFNFSSTYSRHSDVPFPLQYLESLDDITNTEYFIKTSVKNSHLKEIAPILYLQSDCETSTERDLYVKELMKIAKIDSFGSCLNNKKLPKKFTKDYLNNLNENDFLNFVAKYKFVIAIENGVCEDYITEKFWRAIKVGIVPIYFGSPSIKDWLPNNKSAILLQDFPTPEILNDHLNKLLNNDFLYEEYLEHKIKKLIRNVRLMDEFRNRSYQTDSLQTIKVFECFVCKKIHDKLSGKMESNVVNQSHYNCPKPLSALSLSVNPKNSWVYSWEYNEKKTKDIYETIIL